MGHFIFGMSLLTILFMGLGIGIAYRFVRSEFPNVDILKKHYPFVRYQGPKRPPTVTLQPYPPASWVSMSSISKEAIGAIVVSEDWAFFQHKGYDANQIREAIREDLEEKRFARGASTITQQVVKNVFLSSDKTIWRKFKELVLAVDLEGDVGKRRILEVYLNIAEWGEGIYGIGRASQFYFSKHPSELTAKEGAFLAMLLPSPKRYSQSFRSRKLTSYARKTIDSILGKMSQARYISDEDREVQRGVPLSFEVPEEGLPAQDFGDSEIGDES
jgi:monofunctional biosynthetic peptidoglycan transglycosylase